MKPKQIAPKKYPDINSAPVKRLLKWIISTVSATGGGVTYTQVKNFVNSTERKTAASYDVKDILKTFLDNGRLQKVGYKYVLPQSPNKKQVSKKATEKNEVLKKATEKNEVLKKAIGKQEVAKKTTDEMKIAKKTPENKSADNSLMQNVRTSPPENKVKRSPGILHVRDTVMTEMSPLDRDASNINIFSHTMNDELPSQTILPNIQFQTISTTAPFQTVIAEEPLQNTIGAELSKFSQTFNAEESAQNTEDGTSTQNAGEDNGKVPNLAIDTGFNK